MRPTALLALPLLLVSSVAVADDPPPEEPADAAPAGPPPPVTYGLTGSNLIIQVFKDEGGLASGLAHNHAIKATSVSGSFTWDAADPSACQLKATVPVASLSPDETSVRKQVGLEGEISAGQREDIKKNMLASDQLDGGNHPNITFESTGCSGSGDKVTLKGNLSIRGKSKSVSVPLSFSADASSFSGKGTLTINATDFGFEPYSAMFGQIGNRNDMKLHVNLGGPAR
jgi:polyisoprenoid-binding protein YceI